MVEEKKTALDEYLDNFGEREERIWGELLTKIKERYEDPKYRNSLPILTLIFLLLLLGLIDQHIDKPEESKIRMLVVDLIMGLFVYFANLFGGEEMKSSVKELRAKAREGYIARTQGFVAGINQVFRPGLKEAARIELELGFDHLEENAEKHDKLLEDYAKALEANKKAFEVKSKAFEDSSKALEVNSKELEDKKGKVSQLTHKLDITYDKMDALKLEVQKMKKAMQKGQTATNESIKASQEEMRAVMQAEREERQAVMRAEREERQAEREIDKLEMREMLQTTLKAAVQTAVQVTMEVMLNKKLHSRTPSEARSHSGNSQSLSTELNVRPVTSGASEKYGYRCGKYHDVFRSTNTYENPETEKERYVRLAREASETKGERGMEEEETRSRPDSGLSDCSSIPSSAGALERKMKGIQT